MCKMPPCLILLQDHSFDCYLMSVFVSAPRGIALLVSVPGRNCTNLMCVGVERGGGGREKNREGGRRERGVVGERLNYHKKLFYTIMLA